MILAGSAPVHSITEGDTPMRAHPPLPVADRGLVIKFATIGAWALLLAALLPTAYRDPITGGLVVLLAMVTVIGAALAIAGIVRHDNLVTEVAGLCMMFAAPVGYVILVSVTATVGLLQGNTDRVALVALSVLQVEVIATRLAFLIHRRREVNGDDVPEVRR